MPRPTPCVPLVSVLACVLATGCASERDRIESSLGRAFEAKLAGCAPIAWEPNPEHPIRRGGCMTGDWRNGRPATLAALSHAGRVRVTAEKPGRFSWAGDRQYELVAGLPIAKVSSVTGTTSYLCWADVEVRIVETGPLEVRDGVLSVNVRYRAEATPRPWAAHLGKGALDTLRRNSFGAHHLAGHDDAPAGYWAWPRTRPGTTATYNQGRWSFPYLRPPGEVTWGTSRRRIVWGESLTATEPARRTRVPDRIFTNDFEAGTLSAWSAATKQGHIRIFDKHSVLATRE